MTRPDRLTRHIETVGLAGLALIALGVGLCLCAGAVVLLVWGIRG